MNVWVKGVLWWIATLSGMAFATFFCLFFCMWLPHILSNLFPEYAGGEGVFYTCSLAFVVTAATLGGFIVLIAQSNEK